jgi:GNAT superfamily N-acetyltransferase
VPPERLVIRREQLDSAAATNLIAALNAELEARYPEPGVKHLRLDPDEVAPGRGGFFVAYRGDRPVGCGAVRLHEDGSAEVKRMYVAAEERGTGVGKAILAVIEAEARRLGAGRLVLETGTRQTEAIGLYRQAGFVEIPAFGEYRITPLNQCFGKNLGSSRGGP